MHDGVFDANVLIDFAAVKAIGILAAFCCGNGHVLAYVRDEELSKGKLKGLPDPCFHEGRPWINIIDDIDTDEYQMAEALVLRLGLQNRGEAYTIAVCKHRNKTFYSRDTRALKVAMERDVRVASTATILNKLVAEETVPYAEVVRLCQQLKPRTGFDPKDLLPEKS